MFNSQFPDDSLAIRVPAGLVTSAEPAVVFASLVKLAVPDLCDACAVDLDDDGATYRVANPPRNTADEREHGQGRVSHPFEDPHDDTYRGVATFTWWHRAPTPGECVLTGLLVEHATQSIRAQRLESVALAATSKVEHLEVGLRSSRHIGIAIGILMVRHSISQQRAFDALAFVSQQVNRKLRDIAVDVVETGWLDPDLLGRDFDIRVPAPRKERSDARGVDSVRRRPPRH